MRRRGAMAMLAVGAATLAGCGDPPGTYDLPLATAFERLKADPLRDFRRNRQCGLVVRVTPQASSGNEVLWRVTSGGREMVWFRALLTPVSATKTKVQVDIQRGADGKELYDGSFFPDRPAVAQPLRPAVEEAVAALLEGRPFDPGKAPISEEDVMCSNQKGMLQEGFLSSVGDRLGAPPRRLPED